jgi:hypothetical protein
LNATTATLIAAPGTMAVHHALCQTLRVSCSIRPQLGLVSEDTPRPRKLTDASIRIARPMFTLVTTMTYGITLGRMWRYIIRKWLLPTAVAASMYCRLLTCSVALLTTRIV